jgi:hypothetical protein
LRPTIPALAADNSKAFQPQGASYKKAPAGAGADAIPFAYYLPFRNLLLAGTTV